MGANVYANGREISGKASDHTAMVPTGDVCLTPPAPPAGPLPIPYPNSATASDTTNGSRTVKIGGKEVGLKNKSTYKKSTGDEAATKAQGMGVISHNITGPVKHAAWSMDVLVEGQNVPRHLDITTHNHSNMPQVPGADKAAQYLAPDPECVELDKKNTERRGDLNGKSSDKTLVGHDADGAGTTVSSMKNSPKAGGAAAAGNGSAHNNHKAVSRLPEGTLEPGGSPKVRSGEETPLCPGSTYKHPAPAIQKSGHAEARLMAGIASEPPSSITFNIDWRPKSGGASKMPCPDCHKMLCAAAEDCEHDISLCDKQNKKQPLDCPAEGEAPEDSYERLKYNMGETEAASIPL